MGTSVLPPLIEAVSSLKQGGRNLETRALLQLPWFELETGDEGVDADVTYGRMERNAACMIRRYLDQILQKSLDGVIREFAGRVVALERRIGELAESARQGGSDLGPADEKPPHY